MKSAPTAPAFFLTCAAIAWPQTLPAHDFELDFLVGDDSNPSKLQQAYDVDTAFYGQTRIELSHEPEKTGFYYHLEAATSVYPNDEDATSDPQYGEETRADARLGFAWHPRFRSGRGAFEFEANYRASDSIFVDPGTGAIARFQDPALTIDEEVGDRFDYSASGLRTSGLVPISEQANWLYDLDAEERTYESYLALEAAGLNKLDYRQYRLSTGFEKWIWPDTQLTTLIGAGRREYVDRRALSYDIPGVTDGTPIAASNLEFTLLQVANRLDVHFGERFHWLIGFEVNQRKDGDDGYYDSTEGDVFTTVQYRNQEFVNIWLSVRFRKGRYDNITQVPSVLDERIRDREGYRVRAEIVRDMSQWTRVPFDVIIGAEAADYTHDDPTFSYDRTRVYAGIRWRPFDLLKK